MSVIRITALVLSGAFGLGAVGGCDHSDTFAPTEAISATPPTVNTPPVGVPAVQPGSGFVVRGLVYDFYSGPVGRATLDVWVHTPGFGYSYGWAYGQLRSNAAGRYETVPLPEAKVSIFASAPGFVQPCARAVELSSPAHDVEMDIELVSRATLDSAAPPHPSLVRGPTLTGLIYETTAAGRQPVTGAELWVDGLGGLGLGLATTISDLSGHYFLCNLPSDSYLEVTKPGFQYLAVPSVGGTTPQQLDIELRRE